MTIEQQKASILAAIAGRGWASAELFQSAAKELQASGAIKLEVRNIYCGNRKLVWVAA